MRVIDPHISERIREELRPEEKLLWVGKPARFPVPLLSWFQLVMLMIWLPLFLYIFYVTGGLENIANSSVPIWIIVLAVGAFAFLALSQAIKQVLGPSRDLYALTAERGLIVREFLGRRVTTLSPEVLTNAHRKGREKVGTLYFYPSRTVASIFTADHDLTAFRNISDAKAVENLIHRTFSQRDLSYE